MTQTVIHINEGLGIIGGVEVYLSQLIPEQRSAGVNAHWVALSRNRDSISIESESSRYCWAGKLRDLHHSSLGVAAKNSRTVFHVHSLSDPRTLSKLFEMAPVVRTMHEPRVFCPGQGKFWRNTERVCDQPFGLHCFYHAYKEGCCNRHPGRLVKSYQNVRFELNYAAYKYAKIIACSRYVWDSAIEAGVPTEKLAVVGLFTPKTDLSEVKASSEVVFAGRLSKTKGVHHLLKAFQIVAGAIDGAALRILGSGIDEKYFRQLASDLNIGGRCRFEGWATREEIDASLADAAVLAFPSIYPEAFGISGIEAMMRSKPVVGYDVGGVSDWLRHRETGILVEHKNISAFADALIELLSEPDKAFCYGRNARKIALEQYSPRLHVERLRGIYDSIDSSVIRK